MLANRSQKYLESRLHDFKNGKVSNSDQEMMSQFVKALSDEDIQALTIFLSEHKEKDIPDVSDDILGGVGA